MEGKITYNHDEKFDIQLDQSTVNTRRLGEIFLNAKIERIELKSEQWQWEQTGNIAVEYLSNGHLSGIAATEADMWVHELRRDGKTLVYLMFPTERIKELAREAIRKGRCHTKAGDNGAQSIALIKLSDILR